MSLSTVREELLSMLSVVTDVPPIHDEEENFKPIDTSDYPFIRTTIMPAESTSQDLNTGKQILKGLFRIDLFGSRSLNTTAAIRAIADSIVGGMNPAAQILLSDCALIIEGSWVETARYDGTVANVPVFVRWRAMAL